MISSMTKTDPRHYRTTLVNRCIGPSTYDARHEQRNEHITHREGGASVDSYKEVFLRKYCPEILACLNICEEEVFKIASEFRAPYLLKKIASGWRLWHGVE